MPAGYFINQCTETLVFVENGGVPLVEVLFSLVMFQHPTLSKATIKFCTL